MQLSIIIVSYNTKELTRQCLQSLKNLTDVRWGKDFEVVVVDNASPDDSAAMVEKEFPEANLVRSGSNLGFARGNNLGVKNTPGGTPYLLFLNPDTTVPDGTLSEMLKFMEQNPDCGLTTCQVQLTTGEIDLDCHRGFPTPWAALTRLLGLNRIFPQSRFFNHYNLGGLDLTTTHEIDSAVGAFMLVRRAAGEKIGWWDEDYFLNGEDIDFCWRLKKAGYKVIYHPAVTITHHRGAAKGTRQESKKVTTGGAKTKQAVAAASVEAMSLFYNKHLRAEYPLVINELVDAGLWVLKQLRLAKSK